MTSAKSIQQFVRLAARGALALIAAFACVLLAAPIARAEGYSVLHLFSGPDGAFPYMGLVQATDGNFYGTTGFGGANGVGSFFKVSRSGLLTSLYSFDSSVELPGYSPGSSPLVQGGDGNFYGIAQGGADQDGTIMDLTPSGGLTSLFDFCCHTNNLEGPTPDSLIQASNGNFFVATDRGGTQHQGSILRLAANGGLLASYSFCIQPNCTDGEYPVAVTEAANGDVYGITVYGGLHASGTIFKISNGTLTTVYSFCSQANCADGSEPIGLIESNDGDIYGTTQAGGAGGVGTVFKLTAAGVFSTLLNLTGSSVGYRLQTQAADNNFYGISHGGGANLEGSIFKMTPTGTLTTLFSFCSEPGLEINHCWSGGSPIGLIQGTDGIFYGVTYQGGHPAPVGAVGVIFSLSVGLGPFVSAKTQNGAVGAAVTILGTNLEGTTRVTFNGTPAAFTVNATGTALTTHVPTGATAGKVQVTTPSGVLSSLKPFIVNN